MANEAQREVWDGSSGEHWAGEAARFDTMLEPFVDRILDAAGLQSGDRVIDVGCGNGALTLAAARRVGADGEVLGLDLSGPMLATARRRAETADVAHLRLAQSDAQTHDFAGAAFDALISRFGVMFFDDPAAAFSNLASALQPGARLAFSCWKPAFDNEWIMVPSMAAMEHLPMPQMGEPNAPGPFAFGDPARVESILTSAGFGDVVAEELVLPLTVASSAEDAVRFFKRSDFSQTLFKGADEATAEKAWASITRVTRERAGDGPLVLNGAAWLVSARRI